jgi:hypothetical protein
VTYEQTVYDRSKGDSLTGLHFDEGRYRVYLRLSGVPFIDAAVKWWYDNIYRPTYYRAIFGSDNQLTTYVPKYEGGPRVVKAVVQVPRVEGRYVVVDFTLSGDPPWYIIAGYVIAAVLVLGTAAITLDKATKLIEATNIGDTLKAVGQAAQKSSSWLAPVVVVAAVLGVVMLVPAAISSGKRGLRQLRVK